MDRSACGYGNSSNAKLCEAYGTSLAAAATPWGNLVEEGEGLLLTLAGRRDAVLIDSTIRDTCESFGF